MSVNKSVQDRLPSWLQWGVLFIVTTIVVIMPFHAFLSTWAGSVYGYSDIWKSWKECLLLLPTVALFVWLSVRPTRWKKLFENRLAWWILGFAIVLVILTLVNASKVAVPATLAGLIMDGRYLMFCSISYILFRFGRWDWPSLRRYAATYVLAAGLLISVIGIVQVHLLPNDFLRTFGYEKGVTIAPYTLIDQNPDAPRAFATLRGPNDFAAYLILPLVISLFLARRDKRWLVATAVLLLAIFESASRSAWVGAVVAAIVYIAITYGRNVWRLRHVKIGIVAAILVTLLSGVAALGIPSVRLEIFHSSPDDSSLTEGSTDSHWQATAGGIERVIQNPAGCGAGCAGPASYYGPAPKISENYYVQLAEETGLVGLITWIGVVVTAMRQLWKQRHDYLARCLLASFVGLSVIGVWLHVWTDDPLALTWWGLAGAVLGYYAQVGYHKQKQQNRNHKITT